MNLVSKDGDFVIIKLPKADVESTVRFLAHSIEQNPDKVLDLSQQIVRGDLTRQDEYVEELLAVFDLDGWAMVLNKKDALNLCDDLADAIYDELPIHMATEPVKPERHLKVVKVCVDCHKGYVKGNAHDCVVF